MPWSPLAGRLNDLPLLIAGPILRQVTPDAVTVWVALRRQADVTLLVLDPDGNTVLRGKRRTIAIGTNLHVVAVTAEVQPPFAPLREGIVYRYDMTFGFQGGLTRALADATESASLAYPPLTLPSFCMPPGDINTLRLIHGSCRLPHGNGPDALALLDDLIAPAASNPAARPHQLLMTGDQIYADDVAASMIVMLTDAADTLLGWQETLPVDAAHGGPAVGAQLSPFARRKVLEDVGFTSEDLDAHLMTFGEYVCMYLFVWSDTLWDTSSLASFLDVTASVKKNTDPRVFKHWERFLEKKRASIESHIGKMKLFRSTVPKVRRALANIPSYMIFDDHEVTDDWNMTRDLCESLYRPAIGLQIVQNALTAYALCQHWGNCPEQFADTGAAPPPPGLTLLRLLDSGNAATYASNTAGIRTRVAVHDFAAVSARQPPAVFHGSGALTYNYTIEGPGHQVIVTDTRSWRAFPRGGDEAPDLLPDSQIRQQIRDVQPPTGGRALLVVLSTNAPPVQPIRSAAVHSTLANAAEHFPDIWESWELPSQSIDRSFPSIDRLFKAITDRLPLVAGERRGPAILLSGDVHISFASRLLFRAATRFEDPPAQRQPVTAVLAQLVASSFRKQTDKTVSFHRIGYDYAPFGTKWLVPRHAPESYVGWNLPAGQKETIGRITYAAGLAGGGTVRRKITGPTTLAVPRGGDGVSIQLEVSRDPDYSYRLDYLTATNEGSLPVNPAPIPPTPGGGTPDARKQAAEAYNKATGNYRAYNKANATTRQIVGLNNLAEITFDWGAGDAKTVIHTLRWRDPTTGLVIFTTYIVNLNPSDPAFPELRVPRLP
jgi:hypothetical protein